MIAIVRLGTPRTPGEGLRLGTARRPPRGVPKADFAKRDFYDVWLPDLAPSAELVAFAQHSFVQHTLPHHASARPSADDEKSWRFFERKYRAEMRRPEAVRLLDLLAAFSRQTNFSVGCYCENEHRCHRSILKKLLAEHGATLGCIDI